MPSVLQTISPHIEQAMPKKDLLMLISLLIIHDGRVSGLSFACQPG